MREEKRDSGILFLYILMHFKTSALRRPELRSWIPIGAWMFFIMFMLLFYVVF
jgi:hypothetical protein